MKNTTRIENIIVSCIVVSVITLLISQVFLAQFIERRLNRLDKTNELEIANKMLQRNLDLTNNNLVILADKYEALTTELCNAGVDEFCFGTRIIARFCNAEGFMNCESFRGVQVCVNKTCDPNEGSLVAKIYFPEDDSDENKKMIHKKG